MKTLKLALFTLIVFAGLIVNSKSSKAAERPEAKKIKAMSMEIRNKVEFPKELLDQDINEKVTVEFKIKEDKSIKVISVSTFNEFLKAYVKKQIESISLSSSEGFEGKVLLIIMLFTN